MESSPLESATRLVTAVAADIASRVSPLYWPYDAVKDARAIGRAIKDDSIVDAVLAAVSGMSPPPSFAGPPIPVRDVPIRFGLPVSAVDEGDVSREGFVSYPTLRRQLRSWYVESSRFYRFLLKRKLDPASPRAVAAVEHMALHMTFAELMRLDVGRCKAELAGL